MGEEVVSKNFIEQEIDKDLAEGRYTEVCTRRSRMVICISDMPSLSCLIQGWLRSIMEHSIFDLMIRIQQKKILSM